MQFGEIFSRHGLPITVRSDNGPQFISSEFRDFFAINGITPQRVTERLAQANDEVERQNSSLLKSMRIAQAENKDRKRELAGYLLVCRPLPHATTGISPTELLYCRKLRTKIPDLVERPSHENLVIRDHDAENKGTAKLIADAKRSAKYSNVNLGDQVLLRQDKRDKLSTPLHPVPHTVVNKAGTV